MPISLASTGAVATIATAIALLLFACEKEANQGPNYGEKSPAVLPETPFEFRAFEKDPFANEDPNKDFAAVLQKSLEAGEADSLFALANCGCARPLVHDVLKRYATAEGALPQVLVPTVRQEIASNSSLSTLLSLPLGIGDLLGGVFASDEKIEGEVRTGLATKLKAGVPGGSDLGSRVNFRFDNFPTLGGKSRNFKVQDQIPRWLMVFNTPNLWFDERPLDGVDHGLQTLEVLRTLSEWNYLFGLDKKDDGSRYGGLLRDVQSGKTSKIQAFDPREQQDKAFYLAGSFALEIPEGESSVKLATDVKEIWKTSPADVELGEQAAIWLAAAKAFARLRPEGRTKVAKLFGDKALLPVNAHSLALGFLPSLSGLLNGPFIDKESRTIYGEANFEGEGHDLADLRQRVRLISALGQWVAELSNLEGAGLDDETEKRLGKAAEDLRPPLQLAVLSIFQQFATSEPGVSIELLEEDDALVAETLASLLTTERRVLRSAFVKQRLFGLCHWFVEKRLQSYFGSTASASYSGDILVWSYIAMQELKKTIDQDQESLPAWLDNAIKVLGTTIAEASK